MRDLRYAARQLVRAPGFTAIAVATLALGIGACVAIFSVVDGVLLRPLPYPRSERLVVIKESLLPRLPEFAVAPAHYFDWRKQATSFENLAALHDGSYNLTGTGDPIRISAGRVTSSIFATLGAHAALGRDFSFLIAGAYFEAMGIRLVRGRLLEPRDGANAPRVTIVNETMARRVFAGEDPIGKRIGAAGSDLWFEIVGVVADVRHDRLDREVPMQAYGPLAQASADWGVFTFVVRADADPGLPAAIRAAIQDVDRGQAITSVRPVSEWLARSMSRQRFTMVLFAVFSSVALLLAAIGLYGVISYTVLQRTGEIGIRMALGAQTGDVLGLVLREGGRLVGLGLVVGLAGALLLTRLLASMLFGVSPHDPLTFAVIALLLSVVAALACALPARRATRVDLMTALRTE
jgi:hypothetical protein